VSCTSSKFHPGGKRPCFQFEGVSISAIFHLTEWSKKCRISDKGIQRQPAPIDALFSLALLLNHSVRFITVVDFVTVKAPKNHKDQQAPVKQFNQKHLIPLNFNRFP
jgi:hypothetical protein